jgi:NHL repeat
MGILYRAGVERGAPTVVIVLVILLLGSLSLTTTRANAGNSTTSSIGPGQNVMFSNGMNASLVLGQLKFYGFGCGVSSAKSCIQSPSGMSFDSSGDLWVSDDQLNRILEFVPPFSNGMNASIEIGQPSFTPNPLSDCILAKNVTASSLCSPEGVAFDKDANLWVVDTANNRVLEFTPPFKSGMSASVVLGWKDFTTNRNIANFTSGAFSLDNYPSAITFDKSGDLWLGEGDASLIKEFVPPFSTGMNVSFQLGSPVGFGTHIPFYYLSYSASTIQRVGGLGRGIAFDTSGDLWVTSASGLHEAVLEFILPSASSSISSSTSSSSATTSTNSSSPQPRPFYLNASVIVGTKSEVDCDSSPPPASADALCFPYGVVFDPSGKMWVPEEGDARVLAFKPPFLTNMSASIVIGQNNFTSGICRDKPLPTAGSLCRPNAVAFDKSGNLWVGDGEGRVLRFGGSAPLPCLKRPPTMLSQTDPNWASVTMGTSNPAVTIGQAGCLLTASAMMLSYLSNSSVTPKDLNTWLTNNQGYDSVIKNGQNQGKYNVIWDKVAEYGRVVLHLQLYFGPMRDASYYNVGTQKVRNDTLLDSALSSDFPVIVQESGHYILATCRNVTVTQSYGYNYTYTIRDPGSNHRPTLDNSFYKNTYLGLRFYSIVTSKSPGSFTATAHSPVELSITDPLGRVTGPGLMQIPDSGYVKENFTDFGPLQPLVPTLELTMPMNGIYKLNVIGTGTGNYTVDFLVYYGSGNPYSLIVNGTATPSSSQAYQFSYSDAPGARIQLVPASPSSGTSGAGLPWGYILVGVVIAIMGALAMIIFWRRRKEGV